jgi:acetyltransferase-like isoleucine patch superfamily enzyme
MSDARGVLKRIVNATSTGALAPVVAAMRVEQAVIGADKSDAVFQAYSQAFSMIPGLSGEYLRRGFYALVLPSCGEDFTVGFGTVLSKQGVSVGSRVYVGMRCTIGHAALGDHVTIGSNVDILSGKAQHRFDDPDAPIQDQGGTYATVTIGENSWLGNGTIVMADIGRRCVVGAGSVVVDPLPDDAIAVGSPARVIRLRR